MRQTRSRTARNKSQRSQLRSAVKKARTVLGDASAELLRQAEHLLDRAARKRLIHPNKAARLKSRMARKGR
jgi:small subunit ribosomal protein S20